MLNIFANADGGLTFVRGKTVYVLPMGAPDAINIVAIYQVGNKEFATMEAQYAAKAIETLIKSSR